MPRRIDHNKAKQRGRGAATHQWDLEQHKYAERLAAHGQPPRKPVEVSVSDADMARMMADYHAKGRTISTGHFPATVTVPDPTAPAGIKLLEFRSREEADAAGFDWVGR